MSREPTARPVKSVEGTIVDRAYHVPRAAISSAVLQRHINALTMVPQSNGFGRNEHGTFEVYHLSSTHLSVPRIYGVHHWGPALNDRMSRGAPLDERVQFVGTLTADQTEAIERVREAFAAERATASPRGGLLVVPCGFGKTVLALYAAARVVRRKLIVLVHTGGLMDQWCDRVRSFLPGATVGVLRQDQLDTEADVLIAMLQTLARRDVGDQLRDRGLVIVDECHHIAASTFCAALARLSCTWCLGLSATPKRRDGLDALLHMMMGPTLFEAQRDRAEGGLVTSLVFDDKITHHTVATNSAGRPMYAQAVNRLTANAVRNRTLAAHIARLMRVDRNVLVLSERVAHLEAIGALLREEEAVPGEAIALFVGASSAGERGRCAKARVLLSTFQMAREGMDYKHLNALCLASGTVDSGLVQAVGRVQRDCGRVSTGDATRRLPLVLDAVDRFSLFENQARKRQRFYRESGFRCQRWSASSDTVVDEAGNPEALFS